MTTKVDAIVVGVGAMGSAAMHKLAARGLSVLGFDQYDVPNSTGSSHGESRVFRRACCEDARYVPLAQRAYELWAELEQAVRETLLVRAGGIHIGAPDHARMGAVESAAQQHGLSLERLDAAAMRARFPMLSVDDGDVGIYEQDTGILSPERCVAAQVISAVRSGALVHGRERVTAIEPDADGVVVTTDRDRYECAAVVVTTGAWLAAADSPVRVTVPLVVERQVQCWFQPRQPEQFDVGAMPVFVQFWDNAVFHGVPRFENPGVKVCEHHGGELTTADDLARTPTRADERRVRDFVDARLPAANGSLVAATVCAYTNTPDEHFVVGAHPEHDRVFVAGGFSGHGFKFAPVIGEIVADLVTTGATDYEIDYFDPGRSET